MDFVGDGTAQVDKGFADVGRVVVGFVRVLGAVGTKVLGLGDPEEKRDSGTHVT